STTAVSSVMNRMGKSQKKNAGDTPRPSSALGDQHGTGRRNDKARYRERYKKKPALRRAGEVLLPAKGRGFRLAGLDDCTSLRDTSAQGPVGVSTTWAPSMIRQPRRNARTSARYDTAASRRFVYAS